MSLINTSVQPFKATAFQAGEFIDVSEDTFKGQWSAIVFYPADFTFVCPTELEDLADLYDQFKAIGVEIYGVSCDTHFAHKAWHDTSEAIGKVKYPLIGDPTGQLPRAFQVMIAEEGISLRGTFLIDRDGVVRHQLVNDLPLGRNADEALRMADALQFHEEHGEVCPAGWNKGDEGMKADAEGVAKYLGTHAEAL